MPSRTVTGHVEHNDGTPWVGGQVLFQLLSPFATGTEVFPTDSRTEVCDAGGDFSIDLNVPVAPGTAYYLIVLPDHTTYSVYIAEGAPVTLQTLITIATTAVVQNALQTLLDQYSVLQITEVNAEYTILPTDDVVRANGTFPVHLPPATETGAVYICKNIGVGIIAFTPQAGETIDGAASVTIVALDWYTVLDAGVGIWSVI